jgi:hypothetical protein
VPPSVEAHYRGCEKIHRPDRFRLVLEKRVRTMGAADEDVLAELPVDCESRASLT